MSHPKSNLTPRDQQFLVKTDTSTAPVAVWVKPQLTAIPLKDALSGGSGNNDGPVSAFAPLLS